MNDLPDRTGDPGESEFGRPSIPSSLPNGSTPGSTANYGSDKEYPFINYVACFLCNAPLTKAQEEGRKFWTTSCGHILCSKHEHEKGRCTSCGQTGVTVHIIDKEMPAELRTFLQPASLLVEAATNGITSTQRSINALKYQNDQLLRTIKQQQKQLSSIHEKFNKSKKGLEEWKREKAEWERKEAEYEVQVVNMRNVIEVNKKDFGPFSHMPSIGLSRISEERDGSSDIAGGLLGKRPRTEGSSPKISLPPPGGRLSLPNGASSSSSHGSSGGRIGQVRTNLDQLRYRPPSTVPHTPASMGMNGGYQIPRSGSAAPFAGSVPNGSATPYSGPGVHPVPRPMTIVDRFRQNGSTGRDDAPLRTSSAMGQHYVPEMQSSLVSRAASPMGGHQYLPQQHQQQGSTRYQPGGFVPPGQTRF